VIRTYLRPGALMLVFLALAACGKQPIEAAVEKNDLERAAKTRGN